MHEKKTVANNRKAFHDYFVDDRYEAGIVLTGTEIKSVRKGQVSLKESYARVKNGEVILYQMNISPYEQGNRFNADPLRERVQHVLGDIGRVAAEGVECGEQDFHGDTPCCKNCRAVQVGRLVMRMQSKEPLLNTEPSGAR